MIIVFDTETTGILNTDISVKDYVFYEIDKGNSYPHIIQLSYVIYNNDKIIHTSDEYFCLKKDYVLDQNISNITGITNEILKKKGLKQKKHSIETFIKYVMDSDLVVAHNISFDLSILLLEIKRLQVYYKYENINPFLESKWISYYVMIENVLKEKTYCTMKNAHNIFKKQKIFISSKGYVKYPRLNELFEYLYKRETVLPLHNSLCDTYYCLLCYVKLQNVPEEQINNLLVYETKLLS